MQRNVLQLHTLKGEENAQQGQIYFILLYTI
jgi:hypothetical protein